MAPEIKQMKRSDFSVFESRLHLTGTLTADVALRIGSGRDSDPTGQDLPVLKDLYGRPYIPGSSFKGAYRAHLERLLRGIDEKLACISTPRKTKGGEIPGCLTQGDIDRLKGEFDNKPAELTEAILDQSCWVCSILGAPWLASKVSFRDLTVVPETWFDRYLVRDGVAIDRDTETAADGMKYDFEAVPPGTAFHFEMVAENLNEPELGLVLLGLREFEQGFVTIGGAASRGLGKVNLSPTWDKALYVTTDTLPDYLAGSALNVTGRLSKEDDRKVYWQKFVSVIQSAMQGDSHA